MGIDLEAIAHHAHYDSTGTQRDHAPGDRYTVHDGGGFTAEQLAAALTEQGLARAIKSPPKPPTKTKAATA